MLESSYSSWAKKCDRAGSDWMGEVVSISERVTTDTSSEMRSRLANALHSKPVALTIDLSHVIYTDTSGIATLIEAMRTARETAH